MPNLISSSRANKKPRINLSCLADINFYTQQTRTITDNRSRLDNRGSTAQGRAINIISSGADIVLQAADLNAGQGGIRLDAGRDIQLLTANNGTSTSHRETLKTSGWEAGWDSPTRARSQDNQYDHQAQTAQVTRLASAGNITSHSGRDTRIEASTLDAQGAIDLSAGSDTSAGNITFAAAKDKTFTAVADSNSSATWQSNSGHGESRETTDKFDSSNTLQSQNRSMVGSTNGNLTLKAGGSALISGSDIVAAQDLNIAASDITVNSGLDQSNTTQSHDSKQSGLTVAVSVGAINTAQTVQQMKQLGGQVKDKRTQALAALTGAMAVSNAMSGGLTQASVSATVGSSESHSDSTQTSTKTSGSTLKAGGNLNLVATANNGQGGNITIQGSDIKAGKDISLAATNDINLLADKSTASQVSHNSSSSSGAGVVASTGKDGFGVTANSASGRGNADGNDVTYTNSHLTAGNTLSIKSGGNTTLKGAAANGKQIIADIGGNLTIESLQDTSTYQSKQSSESASATVSFTGNVSGSASASNSNINSTYASVTEQSGLKAGDSGFQVKVNGNTTLVGGIIASSDKAIADNKNTFETGGTLIQTDIENNASYQADASAYSASVGSTSGASGGVGHDDGNAHTVTKSGIGVSTKSDTANVIKPIFDAQTVTNNVNAQVQITQAFSQQAPKLVGDYASTKLNEAANLRQQANKETDPAKQAALNQQAASLESNWGEGGAARVALHTAVGALSGGLNGAVGAGTTAVTVPVIAEQINKLDIPKEVKQALILTAGAAVGSATGGTVGAAAGLGQVGNNYLKHAEIDALQKNISACKGDAKCINPLIQAARDLSNSRNAMDLLNPALAQDVAAGNASLNATANSLGTNGFAVSGGARDLLNININQQATANAVPVLTEFPNQSTVNRQMLTNNWSFQQSANLSSGLLITGAGAVAATGGGVLYDMGYAAQTTPLIGGLAEVSTGQWVKTSLAGGASVGVLHFLTDPNASPVSITVNTMSGMVAGPLKLGLNATYGLANQWVPMTVDNLLTYDVSMIVGKSISIPTNQVIDSKKGDSWLTSPVMTCGPYPRKPC